MWGSISILKTTVVPAKPCPCAWPSRDLGTLLPLQDEPALFAKYNQSHLESYLDENTRVAFCPSAPWCGHAIEVSVDSVCDGAAGLLVRALHWRLAWLTLEA